MEFKEKQKTMKKGLFILLSFLIALLFVQQISAQVVGETSARSVDSQLSLRIENVKTQQHVFLLTGQSVSYKLRSSMHFKKDRITGITDSTISFEDNKTRERTFMHTDLKEFRIPRSAGRRVAGAILMVPFVVILVGIVANSPQGWLFDVIGASLVILTAPLAGGGIELWRSRRIAVQTPWMLKAIKTIDIIKPGRVISLTLKNGEKIDKMKVEEIDSEKIKGVQISRDARHQFVRTPRTIMFHEMQVLNMKK